MTTREKIIVGLMLLTVVYGVYTVFFEGKGKSGTQEITAISATTQLENLNAFITKVAEASKAGLSEEDKYIIELAETEWKQDPLINAELTDRPKADIPKPVPKVETPDLEITYTGFMQMGDIKFAIINGVEYAIGDRLEQGDYTVSRITPSRVVIVGPNKKRYTFKLEE
ncbi:MAG: hypothetical protein PVG06_19185 [Desulfobacterales bacterium]|jgi:hypothetical protein